MGYVPIADYAAIGDCHTAALVSKQGSIDWYCPGRFDAPAVFCRILDEHQGGYYSVAPAGEFEASRRYRGHTNVLETTFRCAAGAVVQLTDFMAIHRRHSSRLGHDVGTTRQILRMVEGTETACRIEVRFKPTFDFARARGELQVAEGKGAVAGDGNGQRLVLYAPKLEDVAIEQGEFRGSLGLRPGEHAWLVLSLANSEQAVREALDPDVSVRDLERVAEYWEEWARWCRYNGPYRDAVLRSALTLKLLTYEPTGAVVAAPTTSLPERIGGVRNWDYRYAWLRDSSLIIYALSTLGYHEEATDFVDWLGLACRDPHQRPRTIYTVDGSSDLPEIELKHLEGYRGSKPVRTGNAAVEQHQLDIFGDIMSTAYQFRHTVEADQSITPAPPPRDRMSRRNWKLLSGFVDQACDSWQEPDSGIWEVRGKERHFVYSKLMCWTALDRGIRLATEEHLPAPLDRWRKVCGEIRETILKDGYNRKLGAFTQVLHGHELDAAVLAIPRFGLLPATDPRVESTIDRIQQSLMRDGLVERYHADDGLPGTEGTFALCSFWLADALASAGRLDEAYELFERMLGYSNDVGLLSEEIDPNVPSDRFLGNFPQGFSHTALIVGAVNLAAAERLGPEHEAHTDAERAQQAVEASS